MKIVIIRRGMPTFFEPLFRVRKLELKLAFKIWRAKACNIFIRKVDSMNFSKCYSHFSMTCYKLCGYPQTYVSLFTIALLGLLVTEFYPTKTTLILILYIPGVLGIIIGLVDPGIWDSDPGSLGEPPIIDVFDVTKLPPNLSTIRFSNIWYHSFTFTATNVDCTIHDICVSNQDRFAENTLLNCQLEPGATDTFMVNVTHTNMGFISLDSGTFGEDVLISDIRAYINLERTPEEGLMSKLKHRISSLFQ